MALTVGKLVAYITADTSDLKKGVNSSRRDLKDLEKDSDKTTTGMSFGFLSVAKSAQKLLGPLTAIGKAGLTTVAVHALTGALIQLGGAAASASGALIALPGIWAGYTAATKTAALATKNVGSAFDALAEGDAEKLNAALKKLAPNARAFVREFAAIRPQLNALQLDVQNRFFAGLSGQVKTLASKYLPALRSGLAGIATQLNLGALNLGKALGNPAVLSGFQSVLAQTQIGIRNLTPAIQPFVVALAQIVHIGSTQIPTFTSALAGAAEKFAHMVDQGVKSGALAQAMNTGVQVARELGHALSDVAKIIGDVFRAASGSAGDVFTTINQALDGVHKFLSSAQGQDTLTAFFASAHDLLVAISPLLLNLAVIAGTIVAPALSKIGQALLPGLTTAVEEIGPALGKFGSVLADVFEDIGDALPTIGALFSSVLNAIGPLLKPVIGLFTQLAQQLLTQLAPVLPSLTSAFLAVLTAIRPLIPLFVQLISQVLAQAAPIIARVATALAPLVSAFVAQLMPVLPQLVSSFFGLINAFLPLIPALGQLLAALTPLIPVIASLFSAINHLAGFFIGVFVGAVSTVIRGIAGLLNGFRAAANGIGSGASLIKNALSSMVSYASGKFVDFALMVHALPGKISAIAGSMGAAGKSLMNALFNGLKAVVSAGGSFAASIGTSIVNHIIDALNRLLPHSLDTHIPGVGKVGLFPTIHHLAEGGTVLPRPGGTLAVIGEAGRAESVVDTGKLNKLLDKVNSKIVGSTGGNTINVYAQTNASPVQIAHEIGWQFKTAGV